MRKKAVTQVSLDGEIIKRFESAAQAGKETGFCTSAIQNCCLGKICQSNGFLWVHSDKEDSISERLNEMFNPPIPEEWGSDWRDVKGYEGKFKVSEKGVVIALPKFVQCIGESPRFIPLYRMKPYKTPLGYFSICLNENYKKDKTFLHRILAEAFIPNPDNLPFVNHKDENPSNNDLSNLEWCTHQYNCNYGTRNERLSKIFTNGAKSKAVLQCDKQGNVIKEWPSLSEARRNGYSHAGISLCCNGLQKLHKGYIWKFKDNII